MSFSRVVFSSQCLLCGKPAAVELHEEGYPFLSFCGRECLSAWVKAGYQFPSVEVQQVLL